MSRFDPLFFALFFVFLIIHSIEAAQEYLRYFKNIR